MLFPDVIQLGGDDHLLHLISVEYSNGHFIFQRPEYPFPYRREIWHTPARAIFLKERFR